MHFITLIMIVVAAPMGIPDTSVSYVNHNKNIKSYAYTILFSYFCKDKFGKSYKCSKKEWENRFF